MDRNEFEYEAQIYSFITSVLLLEETCLIGLVEDCYILT